MRVTLVKPPERSDLNFGSFSLAVLAAAVRDIAEVKILDATNITNDEAVQAVIETEPDLVGVTTMAYDSVKPVGELLHGLRNAGYKGTLLAGGHGAAWSPMSLIENGADAVVYGEGEQTFRELLLSGVSENVNGLFLKRNGNLLRTAPRPLIHIDSLPEPARDLANLPVNRIAMLETSRGCPHNCAFCEASMFHGGVWRACSPEKVVKDIVNLVTEHEADIIHIVDDNFTANPERIMKITESLRGGPLPLFFIFSARSDDLVAIPELIPELAENGFLRTNIGVETVDSAISDSIGKAISLEQHKRAFLNLRASEMFSVASFIVGLPSETDESRRKNLEFAVEHVDVAQFLPFIPLPGISIGDGSGISDERHVEYSNELNNQFNSHPKVLKRLKKAGKKSNVKGLLARMALRKRQDRALACP